MGILPVKILSRLSSFRLPTEGMTVRAFFPWRWWWYALYGALVLLGCLALRFPASYFKAYCTHRVAQYFPGYEVVVPSLRWRFPDMLLMRNVHIQAQGKAQISPIDVAQLGIRPDFKALGRGWRLSVTAYGGSHQAALRVDRKQGNFTLADMVINGLDLAQLPWLSQNTGRAVSGLVSLQGRYSGKIGQGMEQGSGEGVVQIREGSLALLAPVLSLTSLDLTKVDFLYTLDKQKIVLSKGKLIGKDLEGTFSGQIAGLGGPFSSSSLALTGSLLPLPELIKKQGASQPLLRKFQQDHAQIPLRINGTVGKPSILLEARTDS